MTSESTYHTGIQDGQAFITCHRCCSRSYNPSDIENRYCGHCHIFHEDQSSDGTVCGYCGEPILPGELLAPIQNDTIHQECGFRMVGGSVGHQMCQCHCYGRVDASEHGLTKREAAKAALHYYLSCHQGGFQP